MAKMICSDFETDFTIFVQINRLLGAQKFYHFYAFGIISEKEREMSFVHLKNALTKTTS